MAIDAILLNEKDNVATAVKTLKVGQKAAVRLERNLLDITLAEDIPYGHKFAVTNIKKDDKIIKYGEVIGRATSDIPVGYHAHIQNVESLRGRGDLKREE